MNKTKRIFIILSIFAAILLFNNNKAKAAQYIWPIGGSNANETYKDYVLCQFSCKKFHNGGKIFSSVCRQK